MLSGGCCRLGTVTFLFTDVEGSLIDCMRAYALEAVEAGQGAVGNAILFKHLCRR